MHPSSQMDVDRPFELGPLETVACTENEFKQFISRRMERLSVLIVPSSPPPVLFPVFTAIFTNGIKEAETVKLINSTSKMSIQLDSFQHFIHWKASHRQWIKSSSNLRTSTVTNSSGISFLIKTLFLNSGQKEDGKRANQFFIAQMYFTKILYHSNAATPRCSFTLTSMVSMITIEYIK